MSIGRPTLDVERGLVEPGELVLCLDEVGRGALAGPVSVGLVAIEPHAGGEPEGIHDSKELSAAARERLEPLVREWVAAGAVGHASAAEIDAVGIVAGLRLAGRRAWHTVRASLLDAGLTPPGRALLDGNLDWFTPPVPDLFDAPEPGDDEALAEVDLRVTTRVKGDRDCVGVGAASILAKVERDHLMQALAVDHPAYGWEKNKGYGSAAHRAAIVEHGAVEFHRRSWKLT